MWRVEQGAIVGVPPSGQSQTWFLISEHKFADFDLRFQAIVEEGVGDCAVHFRSQPLEGNSTRLAGFRCAISGKDAPKEHLTGSLLSDPDDKLEKRAPAKLVTRFVKPADNHFHIRCQGKHVLIEVNGIKTVNADFPALAEAGVIAWKLEGSRPPHKVIFKITRFVDLTGLPVRTIPERPSLADAELLKAEMKFESTVKNADAHLLKQFEVEIDKLQRSARATEKGLAPVVEHERDLFKTKGFVPFSRPMRKALAQYAKELSGAHKVVGKALDAAIDRAEKTHRPKLKEALVQEAATVLIPARGDMGNQSRRRDAPHDFSL